jgi:alpha-1,2-mannosyltransferase
LSGLAAVIVLSWFIVHAGADRPWVFAAHYQRHFPDLTARIAQVAKLRGGGNPYLPFGIEAFTYPPAAIFLFWPLSLFSVAEGCLLWTWLSIMCLAATYAVVLESLGWRGRLLTMGTGLWASVATAMVFPPMIECLEWGQTSTILLLLVTIDFLLMRGRMKGALTGIAAAIKLYPSVFIGFWFLARKWSTAVVGTASFLALSVASWILWPSAAHTFVFHRLLGGDETSHFDSGEGLSQSASVGSFIRRMTFIPGKVSISLILILSILVLVAGMTAAVQLDRLGWEVSALVVLLLASVLPSPVAWDHYFTFAPLLLFVAIEVGYRSLLGRASLISLALFIVPWSFFRLPPPGNTPNSTVEKVTSSVLELVARNAYFAASLVVIIAAWLQITSTRRVANSIPAHT